MTERHLIQAGSTAFGQRGQPRRGVAPAMPRCHHVFPSRAALMGRRFSLLSAAVMLSGCALDSHAWVVSRYKDSAPYLFEPDTKAREADPRPDVRGLIGGNIGAVFGRTTVKDVKVSAPRPTDPGGPPASRPKCSASPTTAWARSISLSKSTRGRSGCDGSRPRPTDAKRKRSDLYRS
jgi:hypothetical protein